jgi:uncharacterized membrane protein YqjE
MEKPFILLYKIFVDPAHTAAVAAAVAVIVAVVVVVVVVWDVRKMLVDFIFNNEVYEKH